MGRENVTLSKITPPLLSDIIPRTRLFRLMDSGRRRPILWVCGPPGSGKTTLAASYLKDRKLPCLWYRLDEGDEDAGSFFYYLELAAKKAAPQKFSRTRNQLPSLSPESMLALPTFTRRYFQTLYGRLKVPSVIVFDNYHDLPAGSLLHKVIHDGLAEVPSGLNILFTSRHDPPPTLADFRSKGMVEIIPWNALSLTIKETKAIIKTHGKRLKFTEDAIDTLHRRSGGWVAGLLLLLTEGQKKKPDQSTINLETPEVVFDYLAGEVFERIDDQTKTFLLKTAFLPGMTAPMAESLTDIPESRRILNYLHNHNLFIEKSSGPEPSYQYHPLFREFLLSQVKARFTGDEIAKIQKDAAGLLESACQVENALSLSIDAGDWGNVIRLICTQAPLLMAQGRGGTISAWLSRHPQEVIDHTPWLLYWQGVLNLLTNQKESQSRFERAYNLFDVQRDAAGVYLSWCGVVNTIFHAFEDFSKFDQWIVILDELRAKYPVFPSEDIRARVTYTMFLALIYRNPMHPDFHAWAEEAIEIFSHDRDSCLRMEVAFHLVCYCHMTGNLAKASIIIGQLRESAGYFSEAAPLSLLGWKATEAFYSWLTGSFEKCIKAVEEGLKVSNETGVHHLDYVLLGQGISGFLSSGNLTEAKRLLKKMASSLERGGRNDRCFYHYIASWEALSREDIPHTLEHVRSGLKLVAKLGASWQMYLSQLMMAQALHEKGVDQKA
ncbi:MAG: ATP dependent transcriptional activator, partial [Candidatus Saccharibacteria bacterium GW2011_GWA2_46_10]